MDRAILRLAQPDLGQAWAIWFSTRAGLGPFILTRLIDGPGLSSVVENPKQLSYTFFFLEIN